MTGRQIKRGDILVFYPPPSIMGGDLQNDPMSLLGRMTGLPIFPHAPAFINRAIGLPGETIEIKKGVGVFINGAQLDESKYIKDFSRQYPDGQTEVVHMAPNYDLKLLGDIIGRDNSGKPLNVFTDKVQALKPIVVPPGHLFVMGDNRNNSEDSHIWGFLDQQRIIGRAWRKIFPENVSLENSQ